MLRDPPEVAAGPSGMKTGNVSVEFSFTRISRRGKGDFPARKKLESQGDEEGGPLSAYEEPGRWAVNENAMVGVPRLDQAMSPTRMFL